MEPQTEARAAQSIGPNLGVLAMNANLAFTPLVSQVGGDTGLRPGERVFAITDHLKRIVPLLIAGDVPM